MEVPRGGYGDPSSLLNRGPSPPITGDPKSYLQTAPNTQQGIDRLKLDPNLLKRGSMPSQENLLMAAATMHQMGRLGPMRPAQPSPPLFDPHDPRHKKPNVRTPEEQERDKDYMPIDFLGHRG